MKRRARARRTGGERAEVRRSTSLARLLSIILHPFVLSPITVALATRDWRATAFVGAATILPILAVLLWNLRRGVWSDFDVSRRDQRSGLYWIAIPLFAAAGVFLPAPPWFARSMLALVCALVIALAAGPLLKTSLHMLFALFCTAVLAKACVWSPAGSRSPSRWPGPGGTCSAIRRGRSRQARSWASPPASTRSAEARPPHIPRTA